MTVYSLAPVFFVFNLYQVTPISGGTSWTTPSFAIMGCNTGASFSGVPQSCTATTPSTLAAGDIITLLAATVSTPTPSGAFVGFSCL